MSFFCVKQVVLTLGLQPMKIEVGLNALEAFKTFDKVSGVKRVMLPQETRAV
jgi:hypothetical protein